MHDYSALCITSFASQCMRCTRCQSCTVRILFDRSLTLDSKLPCQLTCFPGTDIIMCDNYRLSNRRTADELKSRAVLRDRVKCEKAGQLSLLGLV